MSELSNENTPVLTINPVIDSMREVTNISTEAPSVIDDSMLNEDEKEQVKAFVSQIDLNNSGLILQYGAATQQKMASFSEKALDNVRSKDLGEVGDMLTGLVQELKSFDADEDTKGFLGFFKKGANKIELMKSKYNKAEVNVNKITEALEGHQVQLLKDVSVLDQLYDLNKNYFKELSMYVIAGKKKLAEVESTVVEELQKKAEQSGLAEDAQEARDMQAKCERFEKKLSDLELTRMVAIQTAPQIRMIQNNDTMMVEKIQSTLVNTIPLWKSQMVLALGVEHSTQAMQAQRAVTDMTNELLSRNAEKLKQATVETARESQRGIVDIETLKQTNESLISTLNEVMDIQTEGRQKRKEAEVELAKMEDDLKAKLLEMRK